MVQIDSFDEKISHDNPLPRYIIAGFLAILLHMSFLIFSISPNDTPAGVENAKFVTLLPLNTVIPDEKLVLQWMDLMDPMATVKPDRINGFSVSLKEKVPEDEKIVLKKHDLQLKRGAFLPLDPPKESPKEKIMRFWNFKSAGVSIPVFVEKSRPEDGYPLWLQENGTVLPQLFKNIDQVRDLVSKKDGDLKETILKIESSGSGLFPRVKLDVSCGDNELDQIAIKAFTIKGQKLIDEKTEILEPGFIAIKWVGP